MPSWLSPKLSSRTMTSPVWGFGNYFCQSEHNLFRYFWVMQGWHKYRTGLQTLLKKFKNVLFTQLSLKNTWTFQIKTFARKRIWSKIQKAERKHPVVLWNVIQGILSSANCLPRLTSQNMEMSLKWSSLRNDLLLQRRMYMSSSRLRTT